MAGSRRSYSRRRDSFPRVGRRQFGFELAGGGDIREAVGEGLGKLAFGLGRAVAPPRQRSLASG